MDRLLSLCIVVAAIFTPGQVAFAHSDLSRFGGTPAEASAEEAAGAHHEHSADAGSESQPVYPGVVTVDPRRVEAVVIKVNARLTDPRDLFVGKPVTKGEVLAELESAELTTVQTTYLGIVNNIEAVRAFSVSSPQKLIEGRMNLEWRGMSARDIDRLELTRQPLKRIAIRAPASGYLYSVNVISEQILNAGVQSGLFTAAGTTIASIARPDAIVVEAAVPVRDARTLRPGRNATVFVPDANRGWSPLPATIQAISGLSDQRTQRRVVRIGLRAPAKGIPLANGLWVTVAFEKSGNEVSDSSTH